MKQLLFFVCIFSCSFLMAQDCTRHLLMQKGAQLEYKVYWFKRDSSPGRAVARLVFEVEQVKDSAGSTWSTIIKRGFSLANEKDHYQRKIVLQCDGRNLFLPYDFYSADTIYTKDIHPVIPENNKDRFGYVLAFTPLVNAITYIVPLVMDCIVSLPEGKRQFVMEQKQGYQIVIPYSNTWKNKLEIYIKSIALEKKEWLTTFAGSSFCYKFGAESNNSYGEYKEYLYLNPIIGLVKYEAGSRYTELISIRK